MTLQEWLAKYDPKGTRTTEVTVQEQRTEGYESPFLLIRHGKYVLIVNPIGLSDHLSVDCHPFVDDQKSTAGAFGMLNGQRVAFPDDLGVRSHGWNSAGLVAVLVGEQS